jgi:OmcA/MtrC family decaheme c-type cytochrome
LAKAESCATCHGGVGDHHQSEYDKYSDASNLELTIQSVTSNGTDGTMTIYIEQNGVPYIAAMTSDNKITGLDQATFYTVEYTLIDPDGTPGSGDEFQGFDNSKSFSFGATSADAANGTYTLTAAGLTAVPADGEAYGYVTQGALNTEGMTLYDNVANAALPFGTVDAYESAANVSSCETCHGKPYMKHGYRAAAVIDVPDFAACKVCHYDTRNGGHAVWQQIVDDPTGWAAGEVADPVKYAYTANIMNDVHMSHAMEFPYPQSMANCATCHAGKLDVVLADAKFVAATCKSCHPVTGDEAYAESSRAPSLKTLWTEAGVEFHIGNTVPCQTCHGTGAGAVVFSDLHTGYDARITDPTDGLKWASKYTASIDSIDVTDNVVTVEFSVSDADMVPYIYLSFYGWDSKNMIIASHSRDGNSLRYEAKPDDTNALFVFTPVGADGLAWTAEMDLSVYAATATNDIPTLIDDGVIKTGIVTIAPRLAIGGENVGLDAVIENFDVADGTEVANYFTGANAVVDNAKCEVCHDKLAVTFHGGSGRSSVEACRNCHVTTNGGSHLEMQSRGIDSYVHAVHSFQAFDVADVFNGEDADGNPIAAFDAVKAAKYALHIEHVFPNFTITNCEACHKPGTYNVPDQSKSMPGLLSGSDDPLTWYDVIVHDQGTGSTRDDTFEYVEKASGRNFGTVPSYATGPASRACGGCHRAEFINEDLPGELAGWNAHTQMGGTLVEDGGDDAVLYGIIDKIMGMFQ